MKGVKENEGHEEDGSYSSLLVPTLRVGTHDDARENLGAGATLRVAHLRVEDIGITFDQKPDGDAERRFATVPSPATGERLPRGAW